MKTQLLELYILVGLNQSCPWDYLQVSAQTLGPIGATILEWDRLACASEFLYIYKIILFIKTSRVHKVQTKDSYLFCPSCGFPSYNTSLKVKVKISHCFKYIIIIEQQED